MSHDDPAATGAHDHAFYNATQTITLNTSMDQIVTYVLVDPCNPPREVMMNWKDGGYWSSKPAFWGADLITGNAGRVNMGALPTLGQWVRLSVPAGKIALRGETLNGIDFQLYDGHAWFDRVGTVGCSTSVAPPSNNLPTTDTIWFDDAPPAGASLSGTWNWDTNQKTSGTQSHTQPRGDGWNQHFFTGGTSLPVSVGEKLVAYILIDPCEPPDEIMIQWYDGSSFEHRAYWGANDVNYGTDGSNSRRRMGDVPAAGQWIRLEIPASQVGLEGVNVMGAAFGTWNGKVWWDRIGKAPATTGAVNRPPAVAITDRAPSTFFRRLFARWRREPNALGFSVSTKWTATPNMIGPTRQYSFYTPELQLLAETGLTDAATPAVTNDYVWFGGEPLAQLSSTGDVAYDFNDHLGAPILQTGGAGTVVWRAEREPYGNRYTVRVGGDRHQPLGLPGQELSESSPDIQYNIYRWYRSSWGRYTQADPEGLKESPHLYGYAANNPLFFVDATGLKTRCGRCDQCPSGKWVFQNPAITYGGGLFVGGSVTTGTLACHDPEMPMNTLSAFDVKIVCKWKGLMAGTGVSISGPLPPFPSACGCNENEVLHSGSGGWTLSFGIGSLDWGGCGDGTSVTPGLGFSLGGGLARTKCEIYRNWNK